MFLTRAASGSSLAVTPIAGGQHSPRTTIQAHRAAAWAASKCQLVTSRMGDKLSESRQNCHRVYGHFVINLRLPASCKNPWPLFAKDERSGGTAHHAGA